MPRTLKDFVKHLETYGPEGVLQAARRDLTDEDYEHLVRLVQKTPKRQGRRRANRR